MRRYILYLLIVFLAGGLIYVFQKSDEPADSNLPRGSEVQLHYSFFSQKEFFDEAFRNAPISSLTAEREKISAVIVNHHLLAPHFIAQGLQTVASEKQLTVVLISPNHFSVGRGPVITSRYGWKTPYGVLQPDLGLIDQLTESGLVEVEEDPFVREHGISNIVAFITKVLPQAKVVPLIFKERISDSQTDAFAEELDARLLDGALVVASLDFSHYHDLATANLHDQASLEVLQQFDYGRIKDLDIDSRPALRILLKYLDHKRAKTFTLLQHSNSAVVAGKLDEPETTSYITGYFSK